MPIIDTLYAGNLRPLQPEGQQTGIYKNPIEMADINVDGIIGDQQADRRYHGGPEKALHQFALRSYSMIQSTYPELEGIAVPGTMGENISSAELDDLNVCIGDIYRMGTALLEVSQPRTPCWKINHRFEIDTLSRFIENRRITGWYYRVLETGRVQTGDPVELLERPNPAVSIDYFLKIRSQHRPALPDLDRLLHSKGLNKEWSDKLKRRRDYLEKLDSCQV